MKKIINLFLTIIIAVVSITAVIWTLSDFSNTSETIDVLKKIILIIIILFGGTVIIKLISKK